MTHPLPETRPITEAPAGRMRGGDEILLGFTRTLRAAGVPVTPDRSRTYLESVAALGMHNPVAVYFAGRASLCSTPADLDRHDLAYAAYFGGELGGTKRVPGAPARPIEQADLGDAPGTEGGDVSQAAVASSIEVLRHRDVASLTPDEKRYLSELFGSLRPRPPLLRAHRRTPSRRGRRDRRVILLLDISGSMSAYAESLLRVGHAYCRSGIRVEVFTLGTRLTQITRPLHHRDADRALTAVGDLIPDWSGGTRLADGLGAFLRRWGRRGLARGAVIVIASDGWERGDPAALGEQMRRLRAVSHAVVWANPHRGKAAYAPVQAGIRAALPHIDHFVAGHSLAAFEELIQVVADA